MKILTDDTTHFDAWLCPQMFGGCGRTWPKDEPPHPQITDLAAFRPCPDCGGPVMRYTEFDALKIDVTRKSS